MEGTKVTSSDARLHSIVAKQPAPFLSKTWALLEDQDNAAFISWSPSGDSFIVHQPDAFARELLPTVFKHNNYTSFVRQLNIYGFRKLPAVHQEFCHPCFKRGQPQLLSQIQRGGMSTSSSVSAEGPAAEIATLRSQVDKLSKALTYTLAELHRRGYDTLRFDWKELVFVDPNVMATAVATKVESASHPSQFKRVAASGSMLHLQHSVEEIRAEKSEHGDGPATKYARTEQLAEALTVPLPGLQQPGIDPHNSLYTQAAASHGHAFSGAAPSVSGQPIGSAPVIPDSSAAMPLAKIPQPRLPNPYASASGLAASGNDVSLLIPHVENGQQLAHPVQSGSDGVPAPPSEGGPLYNVPPATSMVMTQQVAAAVGANHVPDLHSMPSATTSGSIHQFSVPNPVQEVQAHVPSIMSDSQVNVVVSSGEASLDPPQAVACLDKQPEHLYTRSDSHTQCQKDIMDAIPQYHPHEGDMHAPALPGHS